MRDIKGELYFTNRLLLNCFFFLENAGRILTLPLALVKKQIHSSIHCGKPLDLPFFVNYLKCNPVFLFGKQGNTFSS